MVASWAELRGCFGRLRRIGLSGYALTVAWCVQMAEIDWSTAEPEVESWADLVKAMSTLGQPGWIYRGLPSYKYDSISKLERTLHARKAALNESQLCDEENRAIGFFKRRARQVLRSTPPDQDILGWLSLMQHYGAPTRLTDWSASPFVACYFAYERPLGSEDAALWMLNAEACRRQYGSPALSLLCGPVDHVGATPTVHYNSAGIASKVYEGRLLTLEYLAEVEANHFRHAIENECTLPLPLPVLSPDNRMLAQQACFVCIGKLGCDPPVLSALLKPEASIDSRLIPLVKKIRLRKEWRDEALATLDLFNVSADTLFPGLDGVGRATEVFVGREKPEIEGSIWTNLAL
jgi:hypothetical protein